MPLVLCLIGARNLHPLVFLQNNNVRHGYMFLSGIRLVRIDVIPCVYFYPHDDALKLNITGHTRQSTNHKPCLRRRLPGTNASPCPYHPRMTRRARPEQHENPSMSDYHRAKTNRSAFDPSLIGGIARARFTLCEHDCTTAGRLRPG